MQKKGNLFAFQNYNIVPDILVIAKGMGGGLPIGAFVASQKIMSCFTTNPVLGHINTFGGNAVCVAAALATLEIILDENLPAKAKNIENIILQNLKHKIIKEIRIAGALCAVEFENELLNHKIIKEIILAGVISDWFLFCPAAMRIAPPLNIGEDELIQALNKIKAVLDKI